MLQNICNNWATQKTQNLECKVPNSDKIVKADFKLVYKEEIETLLKTAKLAYANLCQNSYEKQSLPLPQMHLNIKR